MRTVLLLLLAAACAAAVPAAVDAFNDAAPRLVDARALLRDVERAQNEYRAAHGRFSGSVRALGVRRPPDVELRVSAQGRGGWSAVATAPDEECAVFHGSAPAPRGYARTAGRVACRGR